MLYFGIPVAPLRYSRSPERACALLRETVASVLAQEDPNFRLLIAAESNLDVTFESPVVERIDVDADAALPHGEWDKRLRVTAIGAEVRARGGGWLMFVDADDLISRRVSAFVNAHQYDADVFVARTGWEHDDRNGRIRLAPRFWNLCGTSMAIRYEPPELPTVASAAKAEGHVLGASNHSFWLERARAAGKRIGYFPFPAAAYRIEHGENLTLRRSFRHGWKREIWRALTPSLPATKWIHAEFHVPERARE